MPILILLNFESTNLGRFTITYLTYPAVVAEWAKVSILIQVERHRRSQVQTPFEVTFIVFYLGLKLKRGGVSGVRAIIKDKPIKKMKTT